MAAGFSRLWITVVAGFAGRVWCLFRVLSKPCSGAQWVLRLGLSQHCPFGVFCAGSVLSVFVAHASNMLSVGGKPPVSVHAEDACVVRHGMLVVGSKNKL